LLRCWRCYLRFSARFKPFLLKTHLKGKKHPAEQDGDSHPVANETPNQQSDNRSGKEEPRYTSINWFSKFVRNYEKEIAAVSASLVVVFTIILASATIFLWRATRDLVNGAEDTAKRQLRAYVIPIMGDVRNFGTSALLEASIRIRNAGQTPAYK